MKIGIVGGMGPLAGVELQKLIIQATPAEKDQDHLEVICATNPKIPDRTASLANDDGSSFVEGVALTIDSLARAGATIVAIPCNTSHSRIAEIQKRATLPVVNMVELAAREVHTRYGNVAVGLLATTGTVSEKIYENASPQNAKLRWIVPRQSDRKAIMNVIYVIKSGKLDAALPGALAIARSLRERGASVILLGCTELSLLFDPIQGALDRPVVDPMRVLAKYLVAEARQKQSRMD